MHSYILQYNNIINSTHYSYTLSPSPKIVNAKISPPNLEGL